ncbi:MAG: glutamate synthase subunit beta [Kangiellaceae bacterium]|nr:glutamate synthase subunit beta [Kangiellaceae bacterium]
MKIEKITHDIKIERDPLNFLELDRQMPDKRTASARKIDFKEIYQPDQGFHSANQAARCLDCGNPYCEWKCPLHNYIPNWLEFVAREKYDQAAELMYETNPLPEICGRVCPQDRLCEQACTINTGFGAVTIGAIEKNITDRSIEKKWRPTLPPLDSSQKPVAIIGAGPAGLACADQLARHGIKAIVYDKYPEIGGLLTFGIPGFKLEKEVIRKRRKFLEDIGVEFRLKTNVGVDIAFEEIQQQASAVFLAMGTYTSVQGEIPGSNSKNVIQALDYLVGNVNQLEEFNLNGFPYQDLNNKKVVVIGGGDTAMDCVRTAIRQGASEVSCVYRRDQESMPGSPREVQNAKEEGVKFKFNHSPVEIQTNSNGPQLAGLRVARTETTSTGKLEIIPNSEELIECDAVIIAFGFKPSPADWFSKFNIETDNKGLIKTIDSKPSESGGSLRTSANGIYAGGDMVRGADLVVTAVAEGIKAAQEIILEQSQ